MRKRMKKMTTLEAGGGRTQRRGLGGRGFYLVKYICVKSYRNY
jgi:hypothetical protein